MYQQTFLTNSTSSSAKETITHHFFVSGIGQKKATVDAAKICGGAENVVKTETQQTFVNGLLGFITYRAFILATERVVMAIAFHNNCMIYPSIWATLSALLINILLGSLPVVCIVISLSLRVK